MIKIAAIIALVVAIAGGAGYMLYQRNSAPNMAKEGVEVSTVANPTNSHSDWVEYKNENIGLELKYPSSWRLYKDESANTQNSSGWSAMWVRADAPENVDYDRVSAPWTLHMYATAEGESLEQIRARWQEYLKEGCNDCYIPGDIVKVGSVEALPVEISNKSEHSWFILDNGLLYGFHTKGSSALSDSEAIKILKEIILTIRITKLARPFDPPTGGFEE
jgi:hypothetical protein